MKMYTSDESEECEYLIKEIHNEMRKIQECQTKLDNNFVKMESYDSIQKALIDNNSLLSVLEEMKFSECSVVKINPVESLKSDLEQQLEFIKNDVNKIIKKIKDQEQFHNRLDKNTDNFHKIWEAASTSQIPQKRIDVIEKNIKLRFVKEKKDLKKIITTLFPDNLDAQDLIAQITEYYFTEGADKYMQLENSDNIAEQIEFLLKTEMFEVNPHNRTQIRLCDLL